MAPEKPRHDRAIVAVFAPSLRTPHGWHAALCVVRPPEGSHSPRAL